MQKARFGRLWNKKNVAVFASRLLFVRCVSLIWLLIMFTVPEFQNRKKRLLIELAARHY